MEITTIKATEQKARQHRETWLENVMSSQLTSGQKLVAWGLSRNFNTDSADPRFMRAWPSAETIGGRINMAQGSTQNALAALRKAGYLKSQGRTTKGRGAHIYALSIPDAEESESTDECTQSTPTDVVRVHPLMYSESTDECTESVSESSKESNKESTTANASNDLTDITRFETIEMIHGGRLKKHYEKLAGDNLSSIPYQVAVDTFKEAMKTEQRTNWEATFKAYTKKALTGDIGDTGDPLNRAAQKLSERQHDHRPGDYMPGERLTDWVSGYGQQGPF